MKKNQLPLALAALLMASQAANSQNTKYGTNAGVAVTTGVQNTMLGTSSGQSTTIQNYNTYVGHAAGIVTVASGNTFIGNSSGEQNTSGYYNSFVGTWSGRNVTTGNLNTYNGASAGRDNVTGSSNVAFGSSAGMVITSGNNNTFLGTNAGNTAIFKTSNNSTFIGYNASTTLTSLNNATAIGANAIVNASNSIVLGDAAAKVGIGISIPSAKLEVNSATAGVSGLKFTQLTSASATAASNGKALSVDANGNVVLVPDVSGGTATQSNYFATSVGIGVQPNTAYMLSVCGIVRAKEVTVETGWCDYVFAKNYKLRSLPALKQYIATNHHLPEIPSAAEVAQNGVQVASMTSKLLLKVEELTLYMIKQNEKIERLERQLSKKAKH